MDEDDKSIILLTAATALSQRPEHQPEGTYLAISNYAHCGSLTYSLKNGVILSACSELVAFCLLE